MWQAVYQRLNGIKLERSEEKKKKLKRNHSIRLLPASTHMFIVDCTRAHRNLISEFAFALRSLSHSLLSFYYLVFSRTQLDILRLAAAAAAATTIKHIYNHFTGIVSIHIHMAPTLR